MQPSQRRVFNLTGTVLHTNLGRAPLPEEAIAAATEAMRDPTTLEYDLDSGRRGERDDHVAGWLTRLTGAEAALAVNNNAGALVLALNALADGRETIVSRGELIEIGGSFRLPDIMARAGTRLREVGTTNRTHLADFAAAIGPQTGLILKAHTSNYAIQGFTAAVPAAKLAALAREHGVPVCRGSRQRFAGRSRTLGHCRTSRPWPRRWHRVPISSPSAATNCWAGPQAGLVVGRADLVARLARNPLKRALRLDKIRLAALEAVLRLYADPDRLAERLPALRLLTRPHGEIARSGQRLLPAVEHALEGIAEVGLVDTRSQIGSGALPVSLLPSAALALRPIEPVRRCRRGAGPRLAALADPGHRPHRGRPRAARPALPRRRGGLPRPAPRARRPAAPPPLPSPAGGGGLGGGQGETMILATAGHIDHGKTALVRALTGVDADRLPEEKRRGLTIDLGFAYARLPDGTELGFVDVPGHERFLPNMLAGVLSIDRVLLVVAADDGPRPQTLEHLDILELIGVAEVTGVVTKIDRVERDRTAAVVEEVEGLLAAAGFAGSPIFPVSSRSGEGVSALTDHLRERARIADRDRAAAPVAGLFRMPIDRAFTLPGIGLVVTGTVAAGSRNSRRAAVDQPERHRGAGSWAAFPKPGGRECRCRRALRGQCRRLVSRGTRAEPRRLDRGAGTSHAGAAARSFCASVALR